MTVITQVFPDEFHLHTLDQFLSATARLHPHVNIKAIVIGLMNRLSTYAARESEADSSEERRKAEEEAVTALVDRLRISKQPKENVSRPDGEDTTEESKPHANGTATEESATDQETNPPQKSVDKPSAEDGGAAAGKGRNIPEDVKLYEIFYEQVSHLVDAQRLPIQDTTALLVSLANLALWVTGLNLS